MSEVKEFDIKWTMVVDLDKCTGCGACMVACQAENNVAPNPDGTNKVRSINWMKVYRLSNHKPFPEHDTAYLPRPCMQCGKPSCVSVCPVVATDKNEDGGIVSQIYPRCIGCRYCMASCPYHARYFNWYDPIWPEGMEKTLTPDVSVRPRGVVEKCTFCHHRWMKAKDKAIAEGDAAIKAMRALNDRIQDETISGQIDRLEEVSGKIFDCVKADPKKLPQIRKFMNYYLPTTLKLLNAYDRMSSQGVEGQNISGTMERVESMMSTIVTAFERQLDSLFGDQALDISTDITVLDNMMAREGLSDDPIHRTQAKPDDGPQDDGIQLEL